MTCISRINKPHSFGPNDTLKTRSQNLNRNFTDVWQYFEEYRKCSIDFEKRLALANTPVDLSDYITRREYESSRLKEGWDDLRVPLVGVQQGGIKDPDWVKIKDNGSGSTGVYSWAFDSGTEEELFFSAQIPHDWKQGTEIMPHIHWMPTNTNTGSVSLGLEILIVNAFETAGNTTILDVQDPGDGTAYKHQIAKWDSIDMTGMKVSCMLLCRVFRDASGSLGTDSYNADALLLEVDFHYKRNNLGSRAEYVK